jgi:hypothetical protein
MYDSRSDNEQDERKGCDLSLINAVVSAVVISDGKPSATVNAQSRIPNGRARDHCPIIRRKWVADAADC